MSGSREDSHDELKPRGQKRVDMQAKVLMEFERFSGFISEYSKNISEGGMFIKTNSPQKLGTVFSFEFKLQGAKLIQGLAEVVWVRDVEDATETKPAGMGVKFVDLDEESRKLIKRIVNTESQGMSDKQDENSSISEIMSEEALFDDLDDLDVTGTHEDSPAQAVEEVPANQPHMEPPVEVSPDQAQMSSSGSTGSPVEAILDMEDLDLDSEDDMDGDTERIAMEGEELESIEADQVFEEQKSGVIRYIVFGVSILALLGVSYMHREEIVSLVNIGLSEVGLLKTEVASAPPVVPNPASRPDQGMAKINTQPSVKEQIQDSDLNTEMPEEVPVETELAENVEMAEVQEKVAMKQPASSPKMPKVALPTANQLSNFRVVASAPSESTYEILLNGGIEASSVSLFETDDPPPRLVVDLNGLSGISVARTIAVNDKRVKQVRFGVHQRPAKVRLVFDLQSNFRGQSKMQIMGDKIVIKIAG